MIMSYRPLSAVLGVQLCYPLCVFSALVACFPQSLIGCTTPLCNLKRKARWSHLKTLLEQRRMATWFPGIFSSHAQGSGGPRIPIKLKSCDPVPLFGNIPPWSGLQIFLTALYFAITTETTKSLTVGSYWMVCDTNRRNRKSSSHHAPHFNDSVPDDDQLSSLTNEITVCLRHISHKTKISWAIWVKTTLKRQPLLGDLRRPPIVIAYGRFEEKRSKHSFMNKLLVVPAFRSKWFSSYQIRGQQFSRVLIGALNRKIQFSYSNSLLRDVSRQLRKATFYCVSWWVEIILLLNLLQNKKKMRSTNPKTL